MTTPRIVTKEQWTDARLEHLAKEKAFTAERDALSRARRDLPWLEITEDYVFKGSNGSVSLLDAFGDHEQLLVYHFMMGPDWEEGCPSCSFWADNYNGTLEHLAARDTALAAVSRAPLSAIEAYKKRMGWSFPWLSSLESSFNFDFAVSFTDDQVSSGAKIYNYETSGFGTTEGPGISAFRRQDNKIFLTYQTFARGLDMLNGAYHMLDITSKGRDEEDTGNMGWLRRHDSY